MIDDLTRGANDGQSGDGVRVTGHDVLVNVKYAARVLGVSERSVARYTASGRLSAVRVGGNVRYRLGDIEDFVEAL